jgi:hypothetical protein
LGTIIDPPGHTHSAGSLIDFDGKTVRGDQGLLGLTGETGKEGQSIVGPVGPRGPQGDPGVDRVAISGGLSVSAYPDLVTLDLPQGALFGTPDTNTKYRLLSGVADVTFLRGHGAFPLPSGLSGIASLHATLLDSENAIGICTPTDASAVGLLMGVFEGAARICYFALVW